MDLKAQVLRVDGYDTMKPIIRGYIPLTALFIAFGASIILISQSNKDSLLCSVIYSLTLTGLFAVSALYHCPLWNTKTYVLMRNIDHAAIFALIAGTATPITLLGIKGQAGLQLFIILWVIAAVGMVTAIFWTHSPKWARALLYLATGWLAMAYFPDLKTSLGIMNLQLLLIGGILYTVGALIYAFKWPNPFPQVFGYHEIFHTCVVIASGFHYKVIYSLVT